MARRSHATSKGKAHRFGGDWTSQKLDVIASYLAAYTKALKAQPTPERPFRKTYIDAFAGTGYRTWRHGTADDSTGESLLFPELAAAAPQRLLDGSARLALKTKPRFDQYVFIERDAERCAALETLRGEFPELAADIRVEQGEANQEIRALCREDWRHHRAVLFLDPYGMQVEWPTIEAVAKTQAIDLWLLFPLGIGVSRLLTRSGAIPAGWRTRLDRLLGTGDWYDEFYRVEREPTLFGNDEEHIVKAANDSIGRYFIQRLEAIFPEGGVARPGVLRNSVNCPLYLLCFAAGNARGAPIAVRIANHLLKELR